MINSLKARFYRLREAVRLSPSVAAGLYMSGNIKAAFNGRLVRLPVPGEQKPKGVAIALRFRNEAIYLDEWVRYHRAAGADHLFLYNNFSEDDYADVLKEHIEAGYVTLIDWPFKPASPGADEDCIKRTIGRYEWVGFIDADEFVVIKDGSSIAEYLQAFPKAPAVGLHWYYFGSNGHKARPSAWVIDSYTRRELTPNRHVKCFVRPECVSQYRNSHNWFYRNGRLAVNENGKSIFGTISKPTAQTAWINHYYVKSLEDYMAKSKQKSTLDAFGMVYNSRTDEKRDEAMQKDNIVEDLSAANYYRKRSDKEALLF